MGISFQLRVGGRAGRGCAVSKSGKSCRPSRLAKGALDLELISAAALGRRTSPGPFLSHGSGRLPEDRGRAAGALPRGSGPGGAG